MAYKEEYDEIEESWNTIVYKDAKQRRDHRARALRSQQWTVQIETRNLSDGNKVYKVYGERRKLK